MKPSRGAPVDRTAAAPTLLTLQIASRTSGVPVNSLRDLIARGHLPIVRLPGSRRVWLRAADLDALIANSLERQP